MGSLADDQTVAQRILEHIQNRSTDQSEAVWREPVQNYLSTDRLTQELQQVLRRSPTPFCPSAALPEPGSYLAREAAGTPLLAVRGADGQVRAFRNACRHRGMQVASGSGTAKAFACPYHGWTYALDGALRRIPDEHGFPGLDKACHGLVPVPVAEKLGLIWLNQDGADLDDSSLLGMAPLLGPELSLHACTERVVDANWKILAESFLEGYHIRATHRETFYPYGFDNLNLVEYFGRNSRVTYPFRRIQKLAEVAPAQRRVDGMLTYVYHFFPNAFITVLSRHRNLVVLEPISVNQTRQIIYTLMNFGDGSAETRELALRDAEFVRVSGVEEDLAVVGAIQRSLQSGANEHFTFGLFEGAISHFHRALLDALRD